MDTHHFFFYIVGTDKMRITLHFLFHDGYVEEITNIRNKENKSTYLFYTYIINTYIFVKYACM